MPYLFIYLFLFSALILIRVSAGHFFEGSQCALGTYTVLPTATLLYCDTGTAHFFAKWISSRAVVDALYYKPEGRGFDS